MSVKPTYSKEEMDLKKKYVNDYSDYSLRKLQNVDDIFITIISQFRIQHEPVQELILKRHDDVPVRAK